MKASPERQSARHDIGKTVPDSPYPDDPNLEQNTTRGGA